MEPQRVQWTAGMLHIHKSCQLQQALEEEACASCI